MFVIPLTEVDIPKPDQNWMEPIARALRSLPVLFSRFFRFPVFPSGGERAKLLWLVRLRWLAVALFFVLAGPALAMGFLSRETIPVYLGMVGVLLIFNILTQLAVSEQDRQILPFWICFEMAFDLCVLTTILAITGGFANPFVALFLLNVALGGILIPGRLSWPFLFHAHTCLGFLQFQLALKNFDTFDSRLGITFAVYHFLLLSFWLVMRSLGAHLERQFEREAQAKITIEKQDRLRAIGALAAGFSHEFASPLNSAKIRLERALRERPTEDISEALESVKACETVVHQMNSSQLDSRGLVLKEVVIAELLVDVVDSWKEEHPETPVRLSIESHTSALIPPINFAQVVLNLLDNAGEAAPGSEIEVSLRCEKERFHMHVSDQGPGFSEAVLARFGEPFVTTKPEGTGLGLYVSHLFCQSLGGALSIERRRDRSGAAVRLEWPRKREGV
jgi:two-component system sensor histidine kinase RegB